jgi:hypothetical protein
LNRSDKAKANVTKVQWADGSHEDLKKKKQRLQVAAFSAWR